MANERDSRVAVVHGCSTEGGDSILSAFTWEPLPAQWRKKMPLTRGADYRSTRVARAKF